MRYYLGMGSNVGDRLSYIKQAVDKLLEIGTVIKKSPVYETEPFGYTEQAAFFNTVIIFESALAPREFLKKIKDIEQVIGRKKRLRWHAREIDIDILEYAGKVIYEEDLTVPHSELEKRNFVLYPLRDADAQFRNRWGKDIETLIKESEDTGKVKIAETQW